MRTIVRRPLPLKVETLETRLCPDVAIAVVDQTVIINSDNQGDSVRVAYDAAGLVSVFVDANHDGDFADAGETRLNAINNGDTIIFSGRGGDDVVDYVAAGIRANGQAFVANMGKGNDVCFMTVNNAGPVALPTTRRLRMQVDGGRGNDFVAFSGNLTILVPPVDGALQLQLSGGRGDDNVSATVLGTQIGGQSFPSVVARLAGGAGNDEMRLEIQGDNFGAEDPDARSKILATVNGDSGDDRITALLNPVVAGNPVPNARKARGARTVDGGDGFDRVTTIGFRVVNHEKGK